MTSRQIFVLGAGSWGGTIAEYLCELGHSIKVWHKFADEIGDFIATRRHPFIPDLRFDKSIQFTSNLDDVEETDILIVAVPSHFVRDVIGGLPPQNKDTIVVNLAKGIENVSLMRMSEVILDVGEFIRSQVVTMHGPSHAEEVAKRIPTAVVAAGESAETVEFIQGVFSSEFFRVYASRDLIGVELGGSVKNVIAIAAGVCDGIGFGDNTKAALITRGIVEIARLGAAMGAEAKTFSGLSGIGDLIVTCLSRHSRNRYVGEEIGKGRKLDEILGRMEMVAEGVRTARSVRELRAKYSVDMPICERVYNVLFNEEDPKEAVRRLMTRELVYEH